MGTIRGKYIFQRYSLDLDGRPRGLFMNIDNPDVTIGWHDQFGWSCQRTSKGGKCTVLLVASDNYQDGRFPPGGMWDNANLQTTDQTIRVRKILPNHNRQRRAKT